MVKQCVNAPGPLDVLLCKFQVILYIVSLSIVVSRTRFILILFFQKNRQDDSFYSQITQMQERGDLSREAFEEMFNNFLAQTEEQRKATRKERRQKRTVEVRQ